MVKWFIFIALVALTTRASADEPKDMVPEDTAEYASTITASNAAQFPSSTDEYGIGSRFGDPGDRWIGGRMACAPHNFVDSEDHVCAHRYYPCGTILVVEYQKTGMRSWCVVADRGPYGANVMSSDGKLVSSPAGGAAWFVMHKSGEAPLDELCPDGGCTGRWRGVIDMSPAVSKEMNHPGMGVVKVWRLKRIVEFQKYLAKKHLTPSS